jgi:magnesium-protoporphyrin IX monomethyl ester (oxidative) cyclase
MKVFRITSEISRQVFPLSIDIENPKFLALLNKLLVITDKAAAQQARGGVMAKISKLTTTLKAGFVFFQLFTMPSKENIAPAEIRLAPSY